MGDVYGSLDQLISRTDPQVFVKNGWKIEDMSSNPRMITALVYGPMEDLIGEWIKPFLEGKNGVGPIMVYQGENGLSPKNK